MKLIRLLYILPLFWAWESHAQISSNGCMSGSQPGFISCLDGSYAHADITSNTTNTTPTQIIVSGPVTAGNVIGLDYSFTFNGTRLSKHWRHTMAQGDTVKSALQDIAAQFRSDTDVQAAIGSDIVSYAIVRQLNTSTWFFQWFQSWPFVDTGNPLALPYVSQGATVSAQLTGGGSALEVNPYTACGRTTIPAGRQPMAGDMLCAHYVTGDVTGQALDQRNVDPFYAQWNFRITDPTPGAQKATWWVQVDTLDLNVSHLLLNGQPAGPIGQPGPQGVPGGNVAGSIVQSPNLTVCADSLYPQSNCVYTRVYKLGGLNITGWTTIATLIPSNVSGSFSMSKIKLEAVTTTTSKGPGTFEGQGSVAINGSAPTMAQVGAFLTSGAALDYTLQPGANNSILVQVKSVDGVHPIASGFARVEYMLGDADGTPVTWTIL